MPATGARGALPTSMQRTYDRNNCVAVEPVRVHERI
jgi:hypothetical protein